MRRTKHHGEKAKQRAFGKGWRWLGQTPGWWVSLFMTRPQRRGARTWEHEAARTPRAELDSMDQPPHGRKPHKYFW